ncbi:MAG: hypothetical protein WKF79_07410 [Nocardioides sp.]
MTESPDGGLVAVPARRRTLVAAPDRVISLDARAPGRCELVVPIGPGRVLRLDATRGSRQWPSRLQRFTDRGWRTIQRVAVPEGARCGKVFEPGFGARGRYYFRSGDQFRALRIERGPTGWRAVRVRAI